MPAVLVDIEVRKKEVVHGAFVAMGPLLEVELPFRRLVLQHLPHARTHAHTHKHAKGDVGGLSFPSPTLSPTDPVPAGPRTRRTT